MNTLILIFALTFIFRFAESYIRLVERFAKVCLLSSARHTFFRERAGEVAAVAS